MLFNYLEKDGKPMHLQSFKGDIVDVSLNLNADSIWGTKLG